MAEELTTSTLVKQYLNISGSTYDTEIARLIPVAQERIARIIGRVKSGLPMTWLSGSVTEKIPGTCFDSIPLLGTPVTSITSVKEFSSSGNSVTLDSTTYRISDDANCVLIGGASWAYKWDLGYPEDIAIGRDNFHRQPAPRVEQAYPYVEVIYVGGYSTQAGVPNDLEQACNELVKMMFVQRTTDPTMLSERLGDYQYQRAGVETMDDRELAELIGLSGYIRTVGGIY